ncbi:MAG: isochorismatase family protein [Desulfobacterales bacterium]|nr:isochorismatase family protein [Desulfobacterales bacterium]
MKFHNPISEGFYSLIDADDSALIVIDVQGAFLDKLPRAEAEQVLNRACWLTTVARWRQIPLVVTAEEIHKQPLAPKLLDALPPDAPIFDKTSFGLAHQPDIRAAVEKTGRGTAVLVGLETDVCVMHSVIGLLELGYRVAVVADATGSPPPGREIGLNRVRDAGALIVNTKGIFYEWLRTIEMVNRFHEELPDMRERADFIL